MAGFHQSSSSSSRLCRPAFCAVRWGHVTEPEPNEREQKEQVLGPRWNLASFLYSALSFFSRVGLFATLWTVARQAPLSTEFSRQEYWNELPCPPPEDLPDLGIEHPCLLHLLHLLAGSLSLVPLGSHIYIDSTSLIADSAP